MRSHARQYKDREDNTARIATAVDNIVPRNYAAFALVLSRHFGFTQEQIADIVAAYGTAAELAKRAGFEMVMLHVGHGWLLNQFLSPYFNKRDDEYGGALENRVRIVREVLGAIREAVGAGFPIEMRMSGSELFEGGYDLEEGCRIAEALEDCELPVAEERAHCREESGCRRFAHDRHPREKAVGHRGRGHTAAGRLPAIK